MDYLAHYHQKGFCVIANAISTKHIKSLQLMADELEADAVSNEYRKVLPAQVATEEIKGQLRAFRINDVFRSHYDLLNHVMSSSSILDVIVSLAGKDVIPLSADVQLKNPGSANIVEWHQDCVYDRKHPYLVLGIYLDDSTLNDGCLRYVMQSQTEKQDVHKLASEYGWNIPRSQQTPVSQGDLIIHDGMILHGSTPKLKQGRRRTLYIEFRPWQSVIESGPQSANWANLRKEWMQLVFNQSAKYKNTDEGLKKGDDYHYKKTLFDDIYTKREPTLPSIWASKKVFREDYPMPKYL